MLVLCQSIEFRRETSPVTQTSPEPTLLPYNLGEVDQAKNINLWQTHVFSIVIQSGQIIEILSSYLSDRQHLMLKKKQRLCYVFLGKRKVLYEDNTVNTPPNSQNSKQHYVQRNTQVPVGKLNNRQHASPHHEVATDVKTNAHSAHYK